jgi:hypothetical protein
MHYTRVYKEISPTYQEVAEALTQLGFREETNSEFFLFVNDKHKSEVKLPARPYDAPFLKANLAGFSYLLFMQGVIKDTDDLAKLIEKNRSPIRTRKRESLVK